MEKTFIQTLPEDDFSFIESKIKQQKQDGVCYSSHFCG